MRDSQRVVITGLGIVSPIGNDLKTVTSRLRQGQSGIQTVPQWREVKGLNAAVAGLTVKLDLSKAVPRKYRRSMGPVAQLAAYATGRAIEDAGLEPELLRSGKVGVALGSTTGSPSATLDWYLKTLGPEGPRSNKATAFLQVMSHTCAANVAVAYGITGRVWGANSACTSASQAIGLAFDTIRLGAQDVMICGGAEEAHFTTATVFDLVGAASSGFNDSPERTPRPFDRQRDGMVVGEGAGTLVLESYERAKHRGARIYGEILSFATNCDGEHITAPATQSMAGCIRRALADAGLAPGDVHYVNAHATGTVLGDTAEAQATTQVFGDRVPIASTKGFVGHTLGACGAIETIFILGMLRDGFMAPTLNLEEVDPTCLGPWHMQERIDKRFELAVNNNFAFGGINTTLVIRHGEALGG